MSNLYYLHPDRNIQFTNVARIMAKFKQHVSVENITKNHVPSKYNEDFIFQYFWYHETTGYKREGIGKLLLRNKFRVYNSKSIKTLTESDFNVFLFFLSRRKGRRFTISL